jgi:hypothetical protein
MQGLRARYVEATSYRKIYFAIQPSRDAKNIVEKVPSYIVLITEKKRKKGKTPLLGMFRGVV